MERNSTPPGDSARTSAELNSSRLGTNECKPMKTQVPGHMMSLGVREIKKDIFF